MCFVLFSWCVVDFCLLLYVFCSLLLVFEKRKFSQPVLDVEFYVFITAARDEFTAGKRKRPEEDLTDYEPEDDNDHLANEGEDKAK